MLQSLADLIQSTADFLFVPVLVVVLFGAGIFLTIRLGAVQFRRFGDALRVFLARPAGGAQVMAGAPAGGPDVRTTGRDHLPRYALCTWLNS